jgi:hypothetical protein
MTDKLNIRPFTDTLRKAYPGVWRPHYDTVAGGGRTVSLVGLFDQGSPVLPVVAGTPVNAGARLLDIQLSADGAHRVSHMVVTRDGALCMNPSNPKADPAPRFMRGSTHPFDFSSPTDMIEAIRRELTRSDHPGRECERGQPLAA